MAMVLGPGRTLAQVATDNPGISVDRVYLTMGMGGSYFNGGTGTIAWVDNVTIDSVIYDFVVTIPVYNLQPSWTAYGGGGVFSAIRGPPAYGPVSPGSTAPYDGRRLPLIRAVTNPNSIRSTKTRACSGSNPVTYRSRPLATRPLTYVVENQTGKSRSGSTSNRHGGAGRPD